MINVSGAFLWLYIKGSEKELWIDLKIITIYEIKLFLS